MTFDQLWRFAQEEAYLSNTTSESVFQSIGLRLEYPTNPWQYYCTPRNTKTFASTGCDGVHYSFLESPVLLHSPIVMTVPMSFANPNIVVAETLYEFLCLGCRTSYFALESLSSCDSDFDSLKSQDYAADLSDMQVGYLHKLSKTFGLFPYVTLEWRLAQLQSKYLDFLQMGEVERMSPKSVAPAAFTFGQFA